MGDGYRDITDTPITIGTRRLQGDVYSTGSDAQGVRFITSLGQSSLSATSSNPTETFVDPVTGDNLPSYTGLGFAGPFADYIESGVYNNQFSLAPPDPNTPFNNANLLPHWMTGGNRIADMTFTWYSGGSTATPYITIEGTFSAVGSAYIEQIIPVRTNLAQPMNIFPELTYAPLNTAGATDQLFSEITYLDATGAEISTATEPKTLVASATYLSSASVLRPSVIGNASVRTRYVRIRFGLRTNGATRGPIGIAVYGTRLVKSISSLLLKPAPNDTSAWPSESVYLSFDTSYSLKRTDQGGNTYTIPATNLVALPFVLGSVPANTTTSMKFSDNALAVTPPRMNSIFKGSIVGISYRLSTAITAGGATAMKIQATNAGVIVWSPLTLTTATANASYASQSPNITTFVPANGLGIDITTSATFAPTTMDVACILWLALDVYY